MGSFFTSTQIYNPNLLNREQFINFFCEEMKENSYVTCNSDESEVSYILRFSDECNWVTLSSEAYEQGNCTSQSDTARIARMLGTYCVNTRRLKHLSYSAGIGLRKLIPLLIGF